ncbi:DUF2927 domain-containing protein [Antarcticimicrobium sediminis]|uniref:DUF2927 domain-containing protein n=1 Tax=Antarcticimicrobium sediminis TaxID=2546227 RepID=A0A4R5F072_9RHOB|nr:DUF2927 domain-containing protein [Antarcticimicrobium sediminis]TDE40719.1 DUF2927 domain-containing protein [Antarcticimicrobium sediminis]
MIRAALLLCLALPLVGCNTVPLADTPTRAKISDSTLPPMKAFASPHPSAPTRSNANIAADFLSLHFRLESGRKLDYFTRFETPVTVRVTGAPPPSLAPDLRGLLSRLRREAGIDIRQVTQGSANITIEAVSRAELRRAIPAAACFVVPNVSSFDEFRRDRRKPKTNWAVLRTRTRLGIFVPYDTSPQELRDCLHEELAQALGPLNDLYRLPDSVFNDDNVHTVLTGFDMLILRATYAPELHSGMTEGQVAAKLPALLARLNPAGTRRPAVPVSETPRNWIDAVQTALGPGASPVARRAAADTAARTAQSLGWQDQRRAFSHYMLGRITQASDPEAAQQHFRAALSYLSRDPNTRLHAAYVVTQTAAYAIATGDGAQALREINPALDEAARSENAALLSTLMLLKAEALDLTGHPDAARSVRLDSLGWARYGFGSDWAVRAKMREIAALNPQNRGRG